MRTLRIFVVLLLFIALPVVHLAQAEPAVQLAGLRVVGSGYGTNGTELRAFHEQSGTTLALIVEAPGNKKIVELEEDKCLLKEFTDDRGHNLLDGVDWGGFPKISESGQFALIEVSSKIRPSPDAERIQAKGTVRMRAAASAVTKTIQNLRLKVGITAKVGQEEIQVMKVESSDDGLTLVIQIRRELMENMKDIRYYTPDGNPLEIWGRGSFTFGNASQMEYNLDTASAPEAVKVEIDIWQELVTLDIPFEIESGLGF